MDKNSLEVVKANKMAICHLIDRLCEENHIINTRESDLECIHSLLEQIEELIQKD